MLDLQVTPQDKRGQAEGIRRQASDIISLSAPIGLGLCADLISAPGAIGFSAIAMAGTCAFLAPTQTAGGPVDSNRKRGLR